VIEWLIVPAYILALSVSMLGPRSFSIIAPLARKTEEGRRRDALTRRTVT
jgi:hypothetical protein